MLDIADESYFKNSKFRGMRKISLVIEAFKLSLSRLNIDTEFFSGLEISLETNYIKYRQICKRKEKRKFYWNATSGRSFPCSYSPARTFPNDDIIYKSWKTTNFKISQEQEANDRRVTSKASSTFGCCNAILNQPTGQKDKYD